MIGKTLAHYEIALLLGKGEIVIEVFHAKIKKLGQDDDKNALREEFL